MASKSVASVEKSTTRRPGFFSRTSIYGFELFMALFGLVTTLVIVDYGIFALCNYFRSVSGFSSYVGELTIWMVAAMTVWLPVTIVFYLRSRSEGERSTLRRESGLYKVLVSIYYAVIILGAIGLSFAAIYSLFSLMINPEESVADILIRIVLPAVIATGVHVAVMSAFPKKNRPSRELFASVFGGFVVVIAAMLLVVTAGHVRESKLDSIVINDLSSVQSSVASYYYEQGSIPSNMTTLSDISSETKSRLDRYLYTKTDDSRYSLCATFATDTASDERDILPDQDAILTKGDYAVFTNFTYHKKGYVCFKIQARSEIQPALSDNITTN